MLFHVTKDLSQFSYLVFTVHSLFKPNSYINGGLAFLIHRLWRQNQE